MIFSCPAGAQPETARKQFYVRGSVGYSTQSLGDLNDDIEQDELVFRTAGLPVTFEPFGGALDLAVEMGMRIVPTSRGIPSISLGVGVSYETNDVHHAYSDLSGSFSDKTDLAILDVTGNLTFWFPSVRWLFAGFEAGKGFGSATEELQFRDFADPTNDLDVAGNFDGSGFVVGVFSGLQYEASGGALLFLKVGYHYRNLGHFDGTITSPQLGSSSGTAVNNAGRPLEFDFSGIYVKVGIGLAFGRTIF